MSVLTRALLIAIGIMLYDLSGVLAVLGFVAVWTLVKTYVVTPIIWGYLDRHAKYGRKPKVLVTLQIKKIERRAEWWWRV